MNTTGWVPRAGRLLKQWLLCFACLQTVCTVCLRQAESTTEHSHRDECCPADQTSRPRQQRQTAHHQSSHWRAAYTAATETAVRRDQTDPGEGNAFWQQNGRVADLWCCQHSFSYNFTRWPRLSYTLMLAHLHVNSIPAIQHCHQPTQQLMLCQQYWPSRKHNTPVSNAAIKHARVNPITLVSSTGTNNWYYWWAFALLTQSYIGDCKPWPDRWQSQKYTMLLLFNYNFFISNVFQLHC